MTLLIVFVVISLSVSAFCSLLEAAVLSLTPTQIAQLSERHPTAGAIWQRFREHIEQPIAVILIVNTAAHTIGATLAGAQFELIYGPTGIVWFSLLFTYLMLQFTEILPKTLGVQHNARIAPLIAFLLTFLIRVFTPIIAFIHFINRPFMRKQPNEQPAPLEEIAALAGLARLSNLISPHQERIIQATSELSLKSASDVMIPCEQVTFLSTSQNLEEAIATARHDQHTRFPICDHDDRNQVLGYVNLKDMFHEQQTLPVGANLEASIRPVHFVTPDQPANDLLRAFIERHEHMAIVRDASGQTLGMVTLEDVVEELVGELEDEYDRLPRQIYRRGDGTWIVGGGVLMTDLAGKLQIDLSDAQGTISAWLIEHLGKSPRPNDVHSLSGFEFRIRRIRRGKVFEVAVRPL